MKLLHILLVLLALIGAAAIAYTTGRQQRSEEIDTLTQQVAEMRDAEKEAAVVKRVSQQMEDIAYQQKSISDEQRILAERQSALAMENARKAEEESRKAKESSRLAEQERSRAEHERLMAVEAEQEARKQRDMAEQQKQISDELSFRALSRSLGSASISQAEADNKGLAATLAFASYYFTTQSNGNIYQSETYTAMVTATHQDGWASIEQNSPVGDLATSSDGCVAVTHYGDMIRFSRSNDDGKLSAENLIADPRYDFRGVEVQGDQIWALDHKGQLLLMPDRKTYSAPEGRYLQLLALDADVLLLRTNRLLVWFSRSQRKFIHQEKMSSTLSTMAAFRGSIYLFFKDGHQSVIDPLGKHADREPLAKEVVTSCVFDSQGRSYEGTDRGSIFFRQGDEVISLVGHSSGIIDLLLCNDDLLVSASFDHTVKLWNLLRFQWILEGNTEWIIPASHTYDGWPFAICMSPDGYNIWVGMSDGEVSTLSASVPHMADLLRQRIDNLTPREWDSYIGQICEPIDFKNCDIK